MSEQQQQTIPESGNWSFGDAIDYLKTAPHKGAKVARKGWNGKGMYICLQKGYPDGIGINYNTHESTGLPLGSILKFRPYLMMFTAQGDFVPWLASQTDILEEDWEIVA